MKLVLYLFILLGATLLSFDLAKKVKDMATEPPPEPTQPIRPSDSSSPSSSPSQATGGHDDATHAEAIKAIQAQLEQYTDQIKQSPEKAASYLGRAELYSQMREYRKALADLNKAAELSPQNPEVYFQRGYILIATGKTDESIQDFSKVLEIEPAHTKARLYRALIQYRNNQFQPALDDCLKILKHDPTFYDAHITASRCYKELNNKTKAIEHLNTYLANAKDPSGIQEAKRLINLWNQPTDQPASEPTTPSADHE